MKQKKLIVIITVILLLTVLLGLIYRFSLYSFRDENQTSTVSTKIGQMTELESRPSIGIVVQGLSENIRFKSRFAQQLLETLTASGHGEVYLLQSPGYGGERVDLVLIADVDLKLSRVPFYKKGQYQFEIKATSIPRGINTTETARMGFEYSSSGQVTVAGIITRHQSQELVMQGQAKEFVKRLNKNLNENLAGHFHYNEQIATVSIRKKQLMLQNNVSEELKNQYSGLIPANVDSLFVYSDGNFGDRIFITYTTALTSDELVEFYADAGDEFYDYAGGRKSLQDFGEGHELNISIKYLDYTDPFKPRELSERTVTIFRWLKPITI